MKRSREFIRKVIAIINRPEMRILPGQLAFFLVLSLIPLVALVGVIGSRIGLSSLSIKEMLEANIPEAVVSLLIPNVTTEGLNFNMIVFFGAAFLLASNGTYSMINTSNEIYKVKGNGIVKRRSKAILMTFILVSLLLFLILVPAFGDTLITALSSSFSNQSLIQTIEIGYDLCKYPVSLILIYFNIKLLYTLAPDAVISSKSTIPGAVFTTVMWLFSSRIYAFYVEFFSRYDLFYGSVSNILVLLFWVYILSYIFTLGMCFNATGVIQETLEIKRKDLEDVKKEV